MACAVGLMAASGLHRLHQSRFRLKPIKKCVNISITTPFLPPCLFYFSIDLRRCEPWVSVWNCVVFRNCALTTGRCELPLSAFIWPPSAQCRWNTTLQRFLPVATQEAASPSTGSVISAFGFLFKFSLTNELQVISCPFTHTFISPWAFYSLFW